MTTSQATYDFRLSQSFADDKLAELDRAMALLLSTRAGTIPLDRDFGIEMDFVDMPPPAAKSLYVAEVTRKIAKYIPAVRVKRVEWTQSTDGQILRPKVVITSV